jgi:pyruvate formate lyase activating enzyme
MGGAMGFVFNIQGFSLHDGTGLRTTVFFKGCPLNCPWCANPEGKKYEPQFMIGNSGCISCGDCGDLRQQGTNLVALESVEALKNLCPSGTITVSGESMTPGEIAREVLKDKPFYSASGGGVTFSGGEPLSQPGLCKETAELLKNQGLMTAVETCLHIPWKNIELVLPYIDEFLCDLKHGDPVIFKEHTGGDLNLILENLKKLDSREVPIRIRVPIIYGFNHEGKAIESILDIVSGLKSVKAIDFMPYHPLGAGKHEALGLPYSLPLHSMDIEEVHPYIQMAESRGWNATIGGAL